MGCQEKVTPEIYEEIKILLKYGMLQKDIAEKVGISKQTISIINNTKTQEEYRNYANEHLGKLQEKKGLNTEKAGEFYRFNQIIGTLREQNKILLRIAEASEKIANAL